MSRAMGIWGALVLLATTAQAGEGVSISGGYSFLQSLEESGGNAPVGLYLSVAGRGSRRLELDVVYHRDRGDPPSGQKPTRQTLTAAVGLRLGRAGGRSSGADRILPYVHLLGGFRHDWRSAYTDIGAAGYTAWGGMAGLGIDLTAGEGFSVRLGADFQIFFDNRVVRTVNLKTLRVLAGLTF